VRGLSKEFPWSDVFTELSSLFENKEYYDQTVVQRARARVVRMWGDPTSLEERKAALKEMKKKLDYKEFEKILEQIMSSASYPLEDLMGSADDPCLMVTSPNSQLALKLFQHTLQTLGKIDVEPSMRSLVKQGISDRTLAAMVREMGRMKVIDEEVAEDIMYSCSSTGLLQSCAELLRVSPNPRTHPIMEIL
jgi:hypothetical protein